LLPKINMAKIDLRKSVPTNISYLKRDLPVGAFNERVKILKRTEYNKFSIQGGQYR
jgi:hypothetical protein